MREGLRWRMSEIQVFKDCGKFNSAERGTYEQFFSTYS